jgi:hypothetical protein
MIKVSVGYIGIDDDCTIYHVVWNDTDSKASVDLRVRVRRPTYGGNKFQDHSEAEGMRIACELARETVRKMIEANPI